MASSAEVNGRIDAIFEAALDLDPAARAAYLERECGEDSETIEAVRRLLDLVIEDDQVFAADAVASLWEGVAASFGDITEKPWPESFGPYRVVSELGRGGMGAVYLADRIDGEFEQRVAIKVVPTPFSTEHKLRRFERERNLLARLSHPNIARFLGGGRTEGGYPYLVMEYVEGLPLDRYCEWHAVGLAERLRLFLEVTDAVQFAHRNLIVHRDLKPSNVIVDVEGKVKLLDFGIALALTDDADEGLTTELGRPMTPAYASPEQFRGTDVTTVSDVYQLGLMLYELVTCCPAQVVAPSRPADWERRICVESLPRPSQQAADHPQASRWWRRLRGDLDTIILHALNKLPDRRYGSVAAMAADLDCFEKGLPIAARDDSYWYRIDRFTRRHRLGVGTAMLIGLLLVGYAVTATIQQRRIETEATKARKALEFLTTSFQDFTRGSSRDTRSAVAGLVTAREVVDRTAMRANEELANQPELQAEVLTRAGELYLQLGHYELSSETLQKALAIRRSQLEPRDRRIADTAALLGISLHYSGRIHEAEPPLRLAYDISTAVDGAASAEACWALQQLADLLHSRGDLVAAELLLEDSFEGCESAFLRRIRANVNRDRGFLSRAVSHYRLAIESDRPEGKDAGLASMDLGYALVSMGELSAAGSAYATATKAFERDFGSNHPVEIIFKRYRSRLALARGELDVATRLLGEVISIQREWVGDTHHLVPRTMVDLAAIALATGDHRSALESANEGLARYRDFAIPDHWMALEGRQIVGACSLASGDAGSAASQLRALIERQQEMLAPTDPRLGVSLALLAEALDRSGLFEDAAPIRAEAAAIFHGQPGALVLPCRIYGPLIPSLRRADGSSACAS